MHLDASLLAINSKINKASLQSLIDSGQVDSMPKLLSLIGDIEGCEIMRSGNGFIVIGQPTGKLIRVTFNFANEFTSVRSVMSGGCSLRDANQSNVKLSRLNG